MMKPKKNPVTKLVAAGAKAVARTVVGSNKDVKTNKAINKTLEKTFGAKTITAGKAKAPAKVQKGLDKTSNRVPTINAKAKLSSTGKVQITENGFTGTSRGSNKAAAKGNAPKRTPGVKKNTSLQRSINKSNNNLKK
jgi:hypothetical protein